MPFLGEHRGAGGPEGHRGRGFLEALEELASRQKPQCVLPSAGSGDGRGLAETRIVAATACGRHVLSVALRSPPGPCRTPWGLIGVLTVPIWDTGLRVK